MNDNPRRVDVDEYWLREWAAEGLIQLDRLLERHAAFERYLADRQRQDPESTDEKP